MMLPLAGVDTGAPLATPGLSPGPGPPGPGGGNTFLMCPARRLLPWGQGPDLTGVLVTNLDAWN